MATQKRGWGAVDGPKRANVGEDPAPTLPLGGGNGSVAAVTVRDIDVTKFEIGKELKPGKVGDRFLDLKYAGKRFAIQWGEFWEYKRAPFKAGPPKMNLEGGWGMQIEIEQDEYDKWVEVEETLVAALKDRRGELFETKKASKPGKEPKELSVTDFEDKFNSILKPADVDKGYKAQMRVSVQHEAKGPEGRPNRMPRISKANLKSNDKGYGWNKEEPATIDDLNANISVSPIAELSRSGIYFGGTGWGLKFNLESAMIWKNMSANTRPEFDTSNRQPFPESDDENDEKHGAKKLKAADEDETQVRPFIADALLGYDDGSGGNGTAPAEGEANGPEQE